MKRSKVKEKKLKDKATSFFAKQQASKPQDLPLKITVSGHHIHITEGLEQAVRDKALDFFSKVKKVQHLDAKITAEKHSIIVHLLLKVGHETLSTSAENTDAYVAIHQSMQKLKQMTNKHVSTRLDSRKQRQGKGELNAEIEEEIPYADIDTIKSAKSRNTKVIPVLHKKVRQISQRKMNLKTLSEMEAIKELEASTDMILFFLGNEDHKFKLIYEKDHGHYDVIEIGEAKYY